MSIHSTEMRQRIAERGPAGDLRDFMSEWSEAQYCASWMSSLEFVLWYAMTGERPLPAEELDADDVTLLKELSTACGGWWYWSDEQVGPFMRDNGTTYMLDKGVTFVQLDEWKKMVEARK